MEARRLEIVCSLCVSQVLAFVFICVGVALCTFSSLCFNAFASVCVLGRGAVEEGKTVLVDHNSCGGMHATPACRRVDQC